MSRTEILQDRCIVQVHQGGVVLASCRAYKLSGWRCAEDLCGEEVDGKALGRLGAVDEFLYRCPGWRLELFLYFFTSFWRRFTQAGELWKAYGKQIRRWQSPQTLSPCVRTVHARDHMPLYSFYLLNLGEALTTSALFCFMNIDRVRPGPWQVAPSSRINLHR